jgi:ComF family protein
VWPAWVYDERAAAVVHALKYGGRRGLAAGLAGELARVVPPGPGADLLMAVPLHSARRRERGYNQAGLLAAALAGRIGVPLLDGAMERVRDTRPQARLDPRARRDNVAGAFRVKSPAALEGRSILLVDDVITTGATLEACLDALARAGARASGVALAWAQ